MGPDEHYDVFLSYAVDDRSEVQALEKALLRTKANGRRLRVFRDERSIGYHESITGTITEALLKSTVLLAYYSRAYPRRPACRLELTFAFLLAQRAGSVEERVLVVNPEDGGDHIEPVELRDLKYRRPPATPDGRRELAEAVARRVAALAGPLGAAHVGSAGRWWPADPLLDRKAVHRYRELWSLHSALHAGEFRLVEQAPPVGVAVVSGLPGAGKTSLVTQYAWEFSAAFPGGVHRFTLSDRDGEDEYLRQLRLLGAERGVPLDGVDDERLLHHLTRRIGEPALWIVDHVPESWPDDAVRRLVVPFRHVRTILVSRERRLDDLGGRVHLTGLAADEALALLDGAYEPRHREEAEELVRELGGHPQDLRVADSQLRASLGVLSPMAYLRRAEGDVLHDTLSGLDETAMDVLGLACELAQQTPIPRAVLLLGVASLRGRSEDEARELLLPALGVLARLSLVVGEGDAVAVHPRVARSVPERARRGCLDAAGHAVAALLTELTGPTDPLVAHARRLAERDELAHEAAVTLLRALIGVDERSAEHLTAARLERRLVERLRRAGEAEPSMVVGAARRLLTVGDYESAADLAGSTLAEHAGLSGPEVRLGALHVVAMALDGQARFHDAERCWTELMALDPGDAVRVDRARALRLRGLPKEAGQLLADMDPTGLPEFHLEHAHLQLLLGRPRRSAAAARRALEEFERTGSAGHPRALEAAILLAGAELAAYARRPYPLGGATDKEQLAELARLRDTYERTLGATNPLTLVIRAGYGVQLAGWHDPEAGRAILVAAAEDARSAYADDHPIHLRISYCLSGVAMLLEDFGQAEELAGQAYEGLRTALGDRHPDTLLALLQYGIAGACRHGGPEPRERIARAQQGLRQHFGPLHDDMVRSYIARVFTALPQPLLQGLIKVTNTATRLPGYLRRLLGRED
ncbi:tetratricopeptide repeat protein [Nonomuraea soli]|uniref:Tetratricopeptide (TPR) repeat protein n=1 Tax=Nonomuraea soli TaxID=1032476 RepID=A0A7W0HT94_9ACTN|nr:toll/interleukin-1 receptor domain-containing protein [Nonomuraea soli]MBA2894491.1 tetratricopeptide (TPR) repeat protein [Nonomuraea soli]